MTEVLDESILTNLRRHLSDEYVDRIIQLFLENVGNRRSAVSDGLKGAEPRAVEVALHSIRGSAQIVGAPRLEALSAELEALARSGDLDGVDSSLAELDRELDAVRGALGR